MNQPNRPANLFTPSPVTQPINAPVKNENRPGPPERRIFTPPVPFNPVKSIY